MFILTEISLVFIHNLTKYLSIFKSSNMSDLIDLNEPKVLDAFTNAF